MAIGRVHGKTFDMTTRGHLNFVWSQLINVKRWSQLIKVIRIPGTVRTKIITEITYGLHFGRSLYGWKDKRITFLMDLVSHLNTILFHGKRRTMRRTKSVRV
jgi:hypothetical protein